MNYLSHEKLTELTGFKTKPAIVRELRTMGITHMIRSDGFPIVSTDHVKKLLGALHESKQHEKEPNFDAL